jgi:UDP-N-acetylglucosamine:LPS N-acetylglucosamine transferase
VPRATVLTASIGAGHDLPAEVLAAELRGAHGWDVEIVDALALAGGIVERAISETTFETPWSHRLFDLEHRLMHDFTPTHRVTGRLGELLAGRAVLRHLAARRPDVVASTYPGSTEVLGRLRRRGRLGVPCVAAITDVAALRFWAHPGIDLHLVTQAEAIAEVREIAGPRAEIRHVRGLSDPRFAAPPSRARAREMLELPADVPVAVVSGGGWAVGDLPGAAEAVLAASPHARVLLLCGSDGARRDELEARFAGTGRVRAMGFTDRMPDVLAAADVLIHSTAGLTVMEALVVGCRVISYGWGVGHIRRNNAAFARHGLATVVADRDGLRAAVLDALASPRRPDPGFAALPTAAAVIAERYG